MRFASLILSGFALGFALASIAVNRHRSVMIFRMGWIAGKIDAIERVTHEQRPLDSNFEQEEAHADAAYRAYYGRFF